MNTSPSRGREWQLLRQRSLAECAFETGSLRCDCLCSGVVVAQAMPRAVRWRRADIKVASPPKDLHVQWTSLLIYTIFPASLLDKCLARCKLLLLARKGVLRNGAIKNL